MIGPLIAGYVFASLVVVCGTRTGRESIESLGVYAFVLWPIVAVVAYVSHRRAKRRKPVIDGWMRNIEIERLEREMGMYRDETL